MYRDGPGYECTAESPNGSELTVAALANPNDPGSLVGLLAYRATVTFPWIMVIASP
jgi:hypothetical protein